MPQNIEDYALIGDCETAALVGRNGSIDWLCWPAFDSDACFCAILGNERNGRWLIAPEDEAKVSRRYLGNSLILETRFTTASGEIALIDFMPPRGKASDIVRLVRGIKGSVNLRMQLIIRFGFGIDIPWVRRTEDGSTLAICGQDMTVLRTPVETCGEDMTTVAAFEVNAGETVPFVLTYGPAHLDPPEPIDPEIALQETETFWKDWADGWSVADLVHHQGVVHRWAAAHVRGASAEDADAVGTAAETERPADLLTWFSAGATDLDRALAAASDDLAAARFLADPPTPREFWARRQAHETTIHRVDALSARLGVLPTAAQAHLDPALAADGIDELLTGFLPRRRSTLRSADAFTVTIAPTDADLAWTVRVSDDPPVTRRGSDPRADAVLAGRVAALYLGLWNRGDEIAETGDQEVLGLWRDLVRISWS